MDMNYYKQYEPIFGAWHITKQLGQGSYGQVFEIERENYGTVYKAALKAITIPRNESEYKQIVTENQSEANATSYFRGFVGEMVKEVALMSKLKGYSNIVSYEYHQVIEHKNDVGWDILIRMELLTPLDDYLKQHPMDENSVMRMGIDLCKALELCEKHGIVHRDIKPENIFVSENGDFKLGDFGIARVAEKSTGASTRVGTNAYMAPEIYRGEKYNRSVDLYSLGLVMYRLLNKNRLPFYPPYPEIITYDSREKAISQRVSGAELPPPAEAGEQITAVIRKACAANQRYGSPTEMRIQLQRLCGIETNEPLPTDGTQGVFGAPKNTGFGGNDETTIVCSNCHTINPATHKFCTRCGMPLLVPDETNGADSNEDVGRNDTIYPTEPKVVPDKAANADETLDDSVVSPPSVKKSHKWKWILSAVCVLLIAAGAGYGYLQYMKIPLSNGMSKTEGKETYKNGVTLYEDGKYEEAIAELGKLPSDSSQYDEAQNTLALAVEAYVNTIVDKVNSYVQNGDYDMGLEILQNAQKVVPDSEKLKSIYEQTYNEKTGEIKDKAISDADQFIAAGDYPSAISTLRKAVDIVGSEEELSAKLTVTESTYKNNILEGIDAVYSESGYDAVISYLKQAYEVMPKDSDISAEFDVWKSRASMDLTQIEYYSKSRDARGDTSYVDSDNYDNSYSSSIEGEDEDYIEYYLGSKYAKLTGYIYVTRDARELQPEYMNWSAARVEIWGDGILLYSQKGFTPKSQPIAIEVDISGVQFLKITFDEAYYYDTGMQCNMIAIGDPTVGW